MTTKKTIELDPGHLKRTPGEILKVEMEKAAQTPSTLATKTGFTTAFISMLLGDRRGIRAGTAMALAAVLSPSPEQWLAYQSNFDLMKERTVSTMVENGTDEDTARGWFQNYRSRIAESQGSE